MVQKELIDTSISKDCLDSLIKILDSLCPHSREGDSLKGRDVGADGEEIPFHGLHYLYKIGIVQKRVVAEVHADLTGDKYKTTIRLNMDTPLYARFCSLTGKRMPELYGVISKVLLPA
ncbi:hypothetical protein HY483_00895 [Candidatus Woesearchaeota archaeon]|nr:hypothetical protein [Candidatus Woesearchaeota archaeon]